MHSTRKCDFLALCYLMLICLTFLSPPASAELLSGEALHQPNVGARSLLQNLAREALHQPNVGARSLLQNLASCPVSFEFQNYTIITSQCKGPNYTRELCCTAFTEFACPFAQYINNLSTDCSQTMFSYINLYGKYPPGLFSNLCQGDKYGLLCEAEVPSPSSSENANAAGSRRVLKSFSVFIWVVLINLFPIWYLQS